VNFAENFPRLVRIADVPRWYHPPDQILKKATAARWGFDNSLHAQADEFLIRTLAREGAGALDGKPSNGLEKHIQNVKRDAEPLPWAFKSS
jgi:hypothetical protein